VQDKSIELLNKAVADEMTAAHQYMFFSFHCEKQGFEPLSNLFRRTAVQEMRHVSAAAGKFCCWGARLK